MWLSCRVLNSLPFATFDYFRPLYESSRRQDTAETAVPHEYRDAGITFVHRPMELRKKSWRELRKENYDKRVGYYEPFLLAPE